LDSSCCQQGTLAPSEGPGRPGSPSPSKRVLPQALAGGCRITNLNLSGNNIGDAGAKALAEMLKVVGWWGVVGLGGSTVFSWWLGWFLAGPRRRREGNTSVAVQLLLGCTRPGQLHHAPSNLKSELWPLPPPPLPPTLPTHPPTRAHTPPSTQSQTNTTLEVLELNGNVIDYEGVGALAEALAQNTTLKTLGLRWALGGGRGTPPRQPHERYHAGPCHPPQHRSLSARAVTTTSRPPAPRCWQQP
jgi:hypothetical protein